MILGTGGYASFPMLRQGARRHIPTAVHESNAVPGLTTKMVAKGAERILVNFEESREQYENPERVVVTGMARAAGISLYHPGSGPEKPWDWTTVLWWCPAGAVWAHGK